MDVVLIKKAKYNLTEDKFTAIPGEVFEMLMDAEVETECLDTLPKVIMFEDRDEYDKYGGGDLDFSKDVFVSKKGQIFCFLKSFMTLPTSNAADTKKDTAK